MGELKYPKCHDCAMVDCGEMTEHYPKCYIKVSDASRPVVKEFAREMEKQLSVNDYKGGWSKSLSSFLLDELISNTGKLRGAINHKDSQEVITRRAANIANFAMMLADNERKIIQ